MAIVVNEYVFFQCKRFKVEQILPGGKVRLIIGHTKKGVSTRDVEESEVSQLNPGAGAYFATTGQFTQRNKRYRYPK